MTTAMGTLGLLASLDRLAAANGWGGMSVDGAPVPWHRYRCAPELTRTYTKGAEYVSVCYCPPSDAGGVAGLYWGRYLGGEGSAREREGEGSVGARYTRLRQSLAR